MYYDYECKLCGYKEEIEHGMLETKEYNCPYCEKPMKKLITGGAGVHYKGIGFYGNKTIDAPRAKHYYQKELVGPACMRDAIMKR
jgi:putative FmdB family regulatory protein